MARSQQERDMEIREGSNERKRGGGSEEKGKVSVYAFSQIAQNCFGIEHIRVGDGGGMGSCPPKFRRKSIFQANIM